MMMMAILYTYYCLSGVSYWIVITLFNIHSNLMRELYFHHFIGRATDTQKHTVSSDRSRILTQAK